jgi:aryl-alcohol dehydrogenase-like predicted oxidoreductase
VKLALGTVQFGLDYGISNSDGKTSPDEACRICKLASDNGIDLLDTAWHYGDSEAVIGRLHDCTSSMRIVTKSCTFDGPQIIDEDLGRLNLAFDESLERLGRNAVEGLLVHHGHNLLYDNGDRLWEQLVAFKQQGKVRKIGASLYSPQQAAELLDRYPLEIVQLPLNLMDQRMLASGMLDRLKTAGVEIHVRSAFLQGLFFMAPAELPAHLAAASPWIERIRQASIENGVSIAALALGIGKHLPQVDKIVIGVNNSEQLTRNLSDYAQAPALDFSPFACNDITLIDPSQWQQ